MKILLNKIIYPVLYLLFIILIFRNIIINFSHSLIDWGDSAFIAWQIFMVREKFYSLDFQNFYNINAHWPFPLSLVFTDTFITQAILASPLFFVKNPILLYNIIFLITLLLNYITAHIFFKKVFKKDFWAFIASFFINNSFYTFDQMIHLQTLNLWPIFLSFSLLFNFSQKNAFKKSLFLGILLTIQFASSVYLAIFQAAAIALFFLLHFISEPQRIKTVLSFSICMASFLILSYIPLIKPYLEFKKNYQIIRDINEIIQNTGEITDLLFPLKGTLISEIPFVKKFLTFNKHFAPEKLYFPGIILTLGSFLGIFFQKIKITNGKIRTSNTYTKFDVFILLISILGFIFSLGPRLKANAQYLEIPLPYLAALKIFSFLHSLRITHRWFILTLIGMVYFTVKFLKSNRPNRIMLVLILLVFTAESIPIKVKAIKKTYINKADEKIKELNTKLYSGKLILLEFPFLNLEKGVPIDYSTRNLLASTYTKVYLVNGYTGVILPEYHSIRLYLENSFPSKEADRLIAALKVNLIKVNKDYLSKDKISDIKKHYHSRIIYEDNNSLIVKTSLNEPTAKRKDIKISLTDNPVFLGYDNRFFLNFIFKNTSKHWYANVENDRLLVKFEFKDEKGKTKYKEILYKRYPIFLSPEEEKKSILDFYIPKKYKMVKIEVYNGSAKIVDKSFNI